MNYVLAFALALTAARPLAAQPLAPPPSSTRTLTLDQVLDQVERNNPEVAAARDRWEAAQKRVAQAATPDKPRVDLERMYAPVPENPISGAKERNVAVTQELPFPTTLWLERRKARRDADIAEQAYLAKRRETASDAEQAYAAWFLDARSADIFNENVDIMRRFSKVAEARYAAGHASQLDALKAQAELTRMLNMTLTVEQERQIDEARLSALLGREAGLPLGVPANPDPGPLDLRLDQLQAQAQAGRPELRQAALEAQKAGTDVALAKSEFLPDLMAQFRYRHMPSDVDSRDVMVGFSVPLWFWRPAAKVAQARAERAGADADLRAMRLATTADLTIAWARAETARRLADIYKTTLLPQAQAALSVADSGYQAGDNTFIDLLDAQRSLLNYRLEYFQDLAEYERRLAELERIVGTELRKP